MDRREFIAGLAGAAALPLAARAQQPPMPVIGFVSTASPHGIYARSLSGFLKGLDENGYVDGRNVAIEYRWAGGEPISCHRWSPTWSSARWT